MTSVDVVFVSYDSSMMREKRVRYKQGRRTLIRRKKSFGMCTKFSIIRSESNVPE